MAGSCRTCDPVNEKLKRRGVQIVAEITGCTEATAPGQPGAQLRQDLGDVPDKVVVHLRWVDHEQPAATSGESGFDVLGAEPGEPIPVLNHDPRHGRVAQQGQELAAVPVQSGPDLGHHLVHVPMPRVTHSVTRATCRSRSARWSADDTRAYTTVRPPGGASRVGLDQDQPAHPPRGHRQLPLTEPPVRRQWVHALARSPLLQVHPCITAHSGVN